MWQYDSCEGLCSVPAELPNVLHLMEVQLNGTVVGTYSGSYVLCTGHIMAERQPVGTTGVVKELANTSATEQQARVQSMGGWHQE